MKSASIIAAILFLPALAAAAPPRAISLYVDPAGKDHDSGRTPQQPFATLARARDEIRRLRPAGATVYLRGGLHVLKAPVVFGPEDSGVTYAAYQDERPVISGGVPISGWKKGPNGV